MSDLLEGLEPGHTRYVSQEQKGGAEKQGKKKKAQKAKDQVRVSLALDVDTKLSLDRIVILLNNRRRKALYTEAIRSKDVIGMLIDMFNAHEARVDGGNIKELRESLERAIYEERS